MNSKEEKIQTFWSWFEQNEERIKNCIENESASEKKYVVDQLNNLILDFGMLTWDIGLDDSDSWFLTISPNCDKDIFEISKQIIDKAPYNLNWIFHSSKPALNWDRKFTVYNDFMDEENIDASSWHFVALEESDKIVKLIIEAKNIQHLDKETAESAVNQFLVHEIGEKARIINISTLEIVCEIDNDYEEMKCSITKLKSLIVV